MAVIVSMNNDIAITVDREWQRVWQRHQTQTKDLLCNDILRLDPENTDTTGWIEQNKFKDNWEGRRERCFFSRRLADRQEMWIGCIPEVTAYWPQGMR